MTLTPLQRAILAALGPRETTTSEVRDALAAARPGHVVTRSTLVDTLEALREQGLCARHPDPMEGRWRITDAGIAERVTGSAVSPFVADLLLELDKAQEGDETPLDTLRRVIRQAAEAADLRSRVTALEAAFGEALDEWEGALCEVHGAAYFASQKQLDAMRARLLPAKGAT